MQPELMADVDINDMVVEFYKFMYRMSEEDIETNIMPMVVAPAPVPGMVP